ncbi:MAG: proline dehydrogenase family protein [Chloroflexi bacterium]|nr:proline dehydrogenase family protein [Chloroflexota bacterium]
MLRSFFLYLSHAHWAKNLIMKIGPARRSAKRFVAGDTLDEAIEVVRKLNQRGLEVTLDHLGESVTDEAGALQAVQAYLTMLEKIAQTGVRATASLKLTQLGLDVREELCLKNMRQILDCAKASGNHITIDMESTAYTDSTLRIFRQLRQEYDNLGTVIQAYLYRSEADMKTLGQEGAFVRLCKGAYKEPADRAFPGKADVDANFVKLVQNYLSPEATQAGAYLGIATHDEKMVSAAKTHVQTNHVSNEHFEFQMLYGIRSRLQEQLHDEGYKVRVYVGYGTEWYPFFMRRLAERPANVWFILSNFFRR